MFTSVPLITWVHPSQYVRIATDHCVNIPTLHMLAWVKKHQCAKRMTVPRQFFGPFPAIINECISLCRVCAEYVSTLSAEFQPFQTFTWLTRPQKEPIKAKDSRTLTSRYKHEGEHRAKASGLGKDTADPPTKFQQCFHAVRTTNNFQLISNNVSMLCEQQTIQTCSNFQRSTFNGQLLMIMKLAPNIKV